MNLLMIEVGNEGDNSRDSSVEMEGLERSIDAPICIDEVYNLIVCKDCGIGVPLDWVLWHVKECHGITMTMEQVRMFLKMENDCMTMSQARDWMSSVWVIKAVKNIPIIPGYICIECQYSAGKLTVMKNHLSKKHKDKKASECMKECKVQLIFKGGLQKYVQIEEDVEMEIDSIENCEWKMAIEREFEESMINVKGSDVNGHGNLRLMNIFIAKTRWDIMVKELDLKEVVKIAGMPKSNDVLHKIILCGRRYIQKSCEMLDKGSIVIKRLLMSAGLNLIEKKC